MTTEKFIDAASGIDSPVLTDEQAQEMPEFVEGKNAQKNGVRMVDCPYSISNASKKEGHMIRSAEYRLKYENKFQAWMYGFNSEA